MKKKMGPMFYTLFFIAAIMLETYCFLELREDIISVICGGCVVLISGYLFLDTIRVDILKQREDYYIRSLENEEKMNQELLEMVKFQKATYITAKRNTSTETAVKDLLEGQMKAVKIMMKYSKDYSEDIITNSRKDTTQLMKAITLELVEINDRVDQLIGINQQQALKENYKDNGSVIHFERRENL